jgi:hypothetical protein
MKGCIKPYTQPAFLVCVAVLAIAGAGKEIVIEWSGAHLKKQALPLKKPLAMLDASELVPYEVINKYKISNKDVLEQLGTDEYLQWELVDTEADEFSPVRYCSLFITYYTGHLDQVPHVPEECYVGGGNQQMGTESVSLDVKGIAAAATIPQSKGTTESGDDKVIKARYVVFIGQGTNIWQTSSKYAVLYFFKTDGDYAGSRTEARAIMGGNLFGKYSYFSKVEWKFYGGGPGGKIFPDKAEAIEASEKLLSIVLPVVEKDHWPDWDRANQVN